MLNTRCAPHSFLHLLLSDLHMRVVRQHGQTALMWAVSSGHTDIARLLLELGADVDHVDNVSAACVGPACGRWLQRLSLFELSA